MDRFRRVQSKQSIRSRSNSCERLFVNRVLTLRVLGCLSLFFLWLWTATILWLTRHNTHSHSSHHTLFSALSPPRQPQPHLHLRSSSTAPFKSFALREKEWKRRTEELQARREHGEDLNDEENFLLEFSHLALTKSMLQGAVAPDRCSFPGPRPRTLPAAVTTGLVEQVAPLVGTSSAALGEYLERRKAQLLPLSHEFCTNEHAEVFPAVRREEGLFGGKAGPAAYVFKEVCTTFNVDSVKRAQRTVVVVDNTNAHPQRCSPCPNPQMNKVWGWNECGIMWLHQMNVQSLADFNTCYKSNRDLIRRHGQRQEPGETPLNSAVYYGGTTLLVQFVQINPGHQLWDFLFSLFPVLIAMDFQTPFFDHVIVQQAPDCPDNLWSCRILRRLGVFRSKEPQRGENLVKEFTGVLPCFERLIAPVPGWNHRNERYNAKALQLVREKVQEAFELATKYKKEQRSRAELKNLYEKLVSGEAVDLKLLLYPHSTKGEAGMLENCLCCVVTKTSYVSSVAMLLAM